MRGHIRLRGKTWYAVLSSRDEFGRRKTIWRSLPDAHGKREAQDMCNVLRQEMKSGKYIGKKGTTLAEWAEHWLRIGCPGKKKRQVGNKSREQYGQLLRVHALPFRDRPNDPTLGSRRLQDITSKEIDRLYEELKKKLGNSTREALHTVLQSCLNAAMTAKEIAANPVDGVLIVPRRIKGEVNHGKCLDADQMRDLIRKTGDHPLCPIIAFACLTGARRGEILALQWGDVDLAAKKITIRRSLEQTEEGITSKGTKTGNEREIGISDDLVDLLRVERDRHLRIVASVPDGVDVDLSLVRLPQGALVFPLLSRGEKPDLTRPRSPKAVSNMFTLLAAQVGYKGLRFHDLRGSHGTALLNAGEPVHSVAARLGHDPTMLLKAYAKRTETADAKIVQSVAGMGLL